MTQSFLQFFIELSDKGVPRINDSVLIAQLIRAEIIEQIGNNSQNAVDDKWEDILTMAYPPSPFKQLRFSSQSPEAK